MSKLSSNKVLIDLTKRYEGLQYGWKDLFSRTLAIPVPWRAIGVPRSYHGDSWYFCKSFVFAIRLAAADLPNVPVKSFLELGGVAAHAIEE